MSGNASQRMSADRNVLEVFGFARIRIEMLAVIA